MRECWPGAISSLGDDSVCLYADPLCVALKQQSYVISILHPKRQLYSPFGNPPQGQRHKTSLYSITVGLRVCQYQLVCRSGNLQVPRANTEPHYVHRGDKPSFGIAQS